jgi:outer membrane protein assembly factor BamE (lipoprotein component of BamABCDE complex)
MTKFRIHHVAFLAFCLLESGCAQSGHKFPVERASEIQIGKTTKDEVRSIFGSPVRTANNADGSESWTYVYVRMGAYGIGNTQDSMGVGFDSHGIVNSKNSGSIK